MITRTLASGVIPIDLHRQSQSPTADRHAARRAARHALQHYLGFGEDADGAAETHTVWCFTDSRRRWLAEAFASEAAELDVEPFVVELPGPAYAADRGLDRIRRILGALGEHDLVMSIFAWGTERAVPYFRVLPNLRSPEGFTGRSAVIRQRYPDKALLAHLLTDPGSVETTLRRWQPLDRAGRIRVTAPGGTDLSLELGAAAVLPYRIGPGCRHAFLPPSEISFGVVAGMAEGEIVVDVTAGEFVVGGEIRDELGRVDEPVRLTVERGYITDIAGGDVARRLEACFAGLGRPNRLLVELGFGLSQGSPTGLIGPDECLQGTCHFGFGDDGFYGKVNRAEIHLDLVCREPSVTRG